MYAKPLVKEIEKIIKSQNLNCSVEEFKDKVDWPYISAHQKLSEEFIREFKDEVIWHSISAYQKLSEEFIREFKNEVNRYYISRYQKLSEEFIKEFKDNVYWEYISQYQKLSEEFIREFKDEVYWYCISEYQKLSEEFIREFKNKVDWDYISASQKLSEEFIREFKDNVYWLNISAFQKLSEEFIKEFNIGIRGNNWLYVSEQVKENYVKENTKYKIEEDENGKYILAYKGIRSDNYSKFNFQYYYEIGKEYESNCDCNLINYNSFGLAAWTLEKARVYCNEKIILVKIYIKDIGAIVHNYGKIRCFKFKVIEEIK